MTYSFDLCCVASPSEPLPSFSNDPLGSNLAPPWGGHKLEYRNKEGKLQNASSLKLEGLEI